MGFTETLQRVKTEAVTAEKGCSSSTEAIYGSATTETGLISDVLTCQSDAAAEHRRLFHYCAESAALVGIRFEQST
jgi:hypothetical protein